MQSTRAGLDGIFAQYERTPGPGAIVGIAQRGMPDYRRAFGVSSIENGRPNTESTRMRIGSSTKQFTCFGILLLAEDGLLSIDDDIRTHITELPEYSRPVTIRQLMSNTGGLRCYLDLIGILASMDRAVPSPLPLHLQLQQHSVNFPAGERLIYCNGGYLLLSTLIERLANMRLGDFFFQRIFEPLGMTKTIFEPHDTKLNEDVATLHQRYPDGSYHRGTIGVPLSGDGAIISNVEDMLRWLTHMDAPVLGNAQTWNMMLSEGSKTEHGYGLGLMHDRYRGIPTIHHGGTVFGGRCQALKVPEHGINVVIMSNASDIFPAELTERVLDVLLAAKLGAPLVATTDAKARRVTGTYYSEATGDVISIIVKDGHAFVDGESGESPLYDMQDGGVRTEAASLGIEIRAGGSGDAEVSRIELTQGAYRALLDRVYPQNQAPGIASRRGTYVNSDCEARASISEDPQPRLNISSPYGAARYALEHVDSDLWFARLDNSWFPLKLVLEFTAEGFYISSGRTKRLEFTRSPE